MSSYNYNQINKIMHSRIRLAIMSFLMGCKESDFTTIKKSVGATDGNLTTHLRKLESVNYVEMRKEFVNRKPVTYYKVTEEGLKSFLAYVDSLKKFIE